MCEAGLLALPFLLVRRTTPPSSPGMTPIAYSDMLVPFAIIVSSLVSVYTSGSEKAYLVGDQALILPRISGLLQVGKRHAYLAVVLVPQVERVARERHTAGLRPLDEGGAVAACIHIHQLLSSNQLPLFFPDTAVASSSSSSSSSHPYT
jgi:hypothetical protein